MSRPIPLDRDGDVIDVGAKKPGRRRWTWLLLVAIVVLLLVASRALSIYLSALWFGSLGYSSVFWYIFKLKLELFLIFLVLTTAILRGGFWLVERAFATFALGQRTIFINQQPVSFSPSRVLRPLAWVISAAAGLLYGFGMRESWRDFALYLHRAQTDLTDPIFNKPVGFYLFTLPIYDTLSEWVLYLSFIILIGAIVYAALTLTQQGLAGDLTNARKTSMSAVSVALSLWLILLGWRFVLSRYPYLWGDHQGFSGVTYVEANHLLPALLSVAVALIVAAVICLINAFTVRKLRILLGALAIPLVVYVVGTVIVPAYVTAFVVKPNELGRETPYITHNIEWTRRAFGIDRMEQK